LIRIRAVFLLLIARLVRMASALLSRPCETALCYCNV